VRTMQKLREDVLAACINCMNEDQQEFLHNQLLPVRRTIHHNMLLSTTGICCPQNVNNSSPLTVFLDDGSSPPVYPSTGQHIINLDIGDVVDVIMINEPGDSFNGDLT